MKKKIVILLLSLSFFAGYKDELTITAEAAGITSQFGNITGDIENLLKKIDKEEAQDLFNFVEEQIEAGNWETEEGLKQAIKEGKEKFNVELPKEQEDKILKAAEAVKKLKISPQFLLDEAKKIYEKYGGELEEEVEKVKEEIKQEVIEEGKEQIRQEVNKSVKDYFTTMVDRVKNFFKGFLNIL